MPFTVAGIESDDNGTVSFSDGSHAPVVVNIVNGVPAASTVNLSGFNDGTVTATLHLNNDAAGNSFTNVVANCDARSRQRRAGGAEADSQWRYSDRRRQGRRSAFHGRRH